MLTFTQAISIAVLSGIVSAFATNFFKARFDRRARQEEWQRTQDRWVLDKSARSAEEIVTVLERVSKNLSYSINAVSTGMNLLSRDRRLRDDYKEKEIDPALSRIDQAQRKDDGWFNYEIRRVSAWFVNDEKVYEELKGLGGRVNGIYEELYIGLACVPMRIDERSLPLDEGVYERAVEGDMNNFRGTLSRYSTVNEDITQYQQEIIRRLRDPKSEEGDSLGAAGFENQLLTKLLRWLKKGRQQLTALWRSPEKE